MPPLRPAPPSLTFLRSFSSTSHCAAKSSAKRLAHEHSAVPPYPYGPSQWYKQSNFGLYGLQKIRFGNMVSEKNEIKTRRYWRPNVLRKRLWSQSLQKHLKIRVTARVLRTIDKCGGLDEYLLGEKAGRIKELGMGGWKLRWRIMQTESVKERFRKQREALGLPPKEDVAVGSDGLAVTKEMVAEEIQKYDDELAKEADVEIGDEVEGAVEGGNFMEEKPAKKGK
jgi:large subunit ribosomal protein L28